MGEMYSLLLRAKDIGKRAFLHGDLFSGSLVESHQSLYLFHFKVITLYGVLHIFVPI